MKEDDEEEEDDDERLQQQQQHMPYAARAIHSIHSIPFYFIGLE